MGIITVLNRIKIFDKVSKTHISCLTVLLMLTTLGGCSQSQPESKTDDTTATSTYDVATQYYLDSCSGAHNNVDWYALYERSECKFAHDWPEQYNIKTGEGHAPDVDALAWHLIKNARDKFREETSPLRTQCNEEELQKLDLIDSTFERVFDYYMRSDYTLGLFNEAYAMTMGRLWQCL